MVINAEHQSSLVILARAIALARPHTRPKGFARAILSVKLTCEICYYTCKCAMYRTPSNFFIDKTVKEIHFHFLHFLVLFKRNISIVFRCHIIIIKESRSKHPVFVLVILNKLNLNEHPLFNMRENLQIHG